MVSQQFPSFFKKPFTDPGDKEIRAVWNAVLFRVSWMQNVQGLFVGYSPEFGENFGTRLKSTALVAFPVHVLGTKFSAQCSRLLKENVQTVVDFLSVGLSR